MAKSRRGSEERSPSPSHEGTTMAAILQVLRANNVSAATFLSTPAFEAFLESVRTQEVGEEEDSVTRRFGMPAEGFQLSANSTARVRQVYRDRYERRHFLAELSIFPEGFAFIVTTPGEPERFAVVLTPPNQVAVRRQDGGWWRRMRRDDDGPAPYTQQWYQAYLRAHNLPAWFLSGQHTGMLHDAAEAQLLGSGELANPPVLPSVDYLETRFPDTPLFPVPSAQGFHHQEVGYQLSAAELTRSARFFPAIATLSDGDRMVVLPSGHIQLRHADETMPWIECPRGQMAWLPAADDSPVRSSYITVGPVRTAEPLESPADLNNTSDRRRTAIQAARASGHYLNLPSPPRGLGEWKWLEPGVDDVRARARGFDNPLDVTLARQHGLLAQGTGRNAGPLIVWMPDDAFFNPNEQPQVPGRWDFMTADAEELARTNFGGQEGFGLRSVPRPTARHIFRLRQGLQARFDEGVDDLTADIELVWIPGTPESDEEESHEQDNAAHSEVDRGNDERETSNEDSSKADHEPNHGFGVDMETGLAHDPLNRGENDQRGGGQARYQTRMLPVGAAQQKRFTVDRSRYHAHLPRASQRHLEWIVTKEGAWRQYDPKKLSAIDWSNSDTTEALNKWREQSFQRNGWPKKRNDDRIPYTTEQKDWLKKKVEAAKGRPHGTSVAWTKEFNKQFGTERVSSGIASLVERLLKSYQKKQGGSHAEQSGDEDEDEEGQPDDEYTPSKSSRKRLGDDDEGDKPSRKKRKGPRMDGAEDSESYDDGESDEDQESDEEQ